MAKEQNLMLLRSELRITSIRVASELLTLNAGSSDSLSHQKLSKARRDFFGEGV